MPTGIELIAAERQRQIDAEGWTPEHDAEHRDRALARAAMCYVCNYVEQAWTLDGVNDKNYTAASVPYLWPTEWDDASWKPKNPIADLTRAGALIAAELDRLTAKAV